MMDLSSGVPTTVALGHQSSTYSDSGKRRAATRPSHTWDCDPLRQEYPWAVFPTQVVSSPRVCHQALCHMPCQYSHFYRVQFPTMFAVGKNRRTKRILHTR